MGCSHCMSDCKPDGQHMSTQVFKDALAFLKHHQIPTWNISGGEPFEHPDILEFINILEEEWTTFLLKCPITFITNGRKLVRDKEIYNRMSKLRSSIGKKNIIIQVTDDPRYYPDPLSDKEKYWLRKLDCIIDTVPSNPTDTTKTLYPQGRALINHPDSNWNTVGPKCVNTILMAKQNVNSIHEICMLLLKAGKVCTPVIAPDGSIKLGESALCPPVASIYDDNDVIINKIKQHKCHQCDIAWDRLIQTHPMAYNMLK